MLKKLTLLILKLRFRQKKFLCLPLLVAVPVLLQTTGCSNCDTGTYNNWGVDGIMNDSMAISTTSYTEEETCTSLGASVSSSSKVKDCKLILEDIRSKKIYWEKKIPDRDCGGMRLRSIQDSVLFFMGSIKGIDGRFAFLKLKDRDFQQASKIEMKIKEIRIYGEWYRALGMVFRPWQNGLVLVNSKYIGGHGNYYALLDTAIGTLKPWNPSGEFEWLNECSDAKWSSAGGLCLKEIADTLGFVLLRNGVDTLAVRYMPRELSKYYKREEPLTFNGNAIISRGWIYLINGQGQVSEKPLEIALAFGNYYDLSGREAIYSD
jgi:hypothetical protein